MNDESPPGRKASDDSEESHNAARSTPDCSVPEHIATRLLNGHNATKGKECRQLLADGPDYKSNCPYQFHGANESYVYIEFSNKTGTLEAQHSITMLCWVYISESSNSPGILFVYYSNKYFGMAIEDATLAAYFNGTNSSDIRSVELALNASLRGNGAVDDQMTFDSTWTVGTGYCAIRMVADMLFLQKPFKFNISLTKQQIKAVKCVSRRESPSSLLPSSCAPAPLILCWSSSSSTSSSSSISLSSALTALTTATMLPKATATALSLTALSPSAVSSPFATASVTSLPLRSSSLDATSESLSSLMHSLFTRASLILSSLSLSSTAPVSSASISSAHLLTTSTGVTMLNETSATSLLKMTTTPLLVSPTTSSIISALEELTRQFIFKLNKTDVRQDASLQEASSLFENVTEQYKHILGNHEEQLVSTVGNRVRRELIFQVTVAFEEFVLRYGFHHLSESKPNINNTNSKLFLLIHRVFHQNASDFHLQDERRQNTIKVSSLNFNSNGSLVVGIQYKDLHELFLTNQLNKDGAEKTRRIDTVIMAATMYPKPQQLRQNVILKFSNLKALNRKRHCVFWSSVSKNNSEGWSEEGCHVVRSKSSSVQTECSCNHMTHFAVLLNYGDDFKVTKTDEKVLKILTYVGLALSITGIILTIIPYLLLTDVGQPLSQIRMSLAGSLGAGQIIFLAGIDATDNKVACVTVAALMQYFLTAAFCWMLVEGIYLYLYVVKVYNINNKMTVYHVVSWGFPAFMVAISLSIAAGKGGGIQTFVSDKYCWMSSDNHLIWMFVAFLALIEVLNLLLIARVIKEMATMQLSGENHIQQIWLSIKACVVFIPLLGITWLFGLLAPVHTSFVYISTILNSFQGFLIFLLHCVRNSQIRERFKRKINAIFPAANNGSPAKEKSRVNQSEIDFGVARKIEVKPCNTTAAISVPTAYLN